MSLITSFGQFGTNDFIEYWTAFRLFFSQSNPYDPALIEQLQRPLGWSEPTPLMMWNPPWLLLVMAPILMLPFPQAANGWLLINFALVIGILLFCLDLIGFSSLSRLQKYLSIPLTLTFFPLYTSLAVGQLGVLLAFAFIGAIWSIIRKRRFFGACCLALWTVKIHLFIPIAVFLFFKSLRNHELWIYFVLASFILAALILATDVCHPGATRQWLSAFSGGEQNQNVVVVEQWVPATLTGGVRLMFAKRDQIPVWPMYLVPGIGVVTLSLLTIRGGSRIGYLKGSILSALCSLVCGPFGWVFDFTLLLPGYLFCALQPLGAQPHLSKGKRALLLPVLLVNVAGWVSYHFLVDHHLYMWFPPAMLLASIPWTLSEDWARTEREV